MVGRKLMCALLQLFESLAGRCSHSELGRGCRAYFRCLPSNDNMIVTRYRASLQIRCHGTGRRSEILTYPLTVESCTAAADGSLGTVTPVRRREPRLPPLLQDSLISDGPSIGALVHKVLASREWSRGRLNSVAISPLDKLRATPD